VATSRTNEVAPLLRSPPFRGIDAAVSRADATGKCDSVDAEAIDRLFAVIREARVGGTFWAPPATVTRPTILVRTRSASEIPSIAATLSQADRSGALWLLPTKATVPEGTVLAGAIDPWSLLDGTTPLIAHGDDEWAALAHIAGNPVRLLSDGRFGVFGADSRPNVADALFGARYRDPFTGDDSGIEETIACLADWRRIFEENRGIVAACGMAWWKRHEIARFLYRPDQPLRFFRSEQTALSYAGRREGAIAVWPSRISDGLVEAAKEKRVPLVRVEDGFVRSVGLGSNLVPPSSVAVDRLGIHYDPGKPSDLEALLAGADFPPPLLARAQALRDVILSAGISKYGGDSEHVFPDRTSDRRLVLVPGQVEDDMSVRLGGGGLASNLELLRRARALDPDAEIWFRPHPDVDAGHRKGLVRDEDALAHADRIVRGGSMARLLERVDAVHVLTSLTGFEALMRGLDVTCHGTPFYAGWGLTRDLADFPDRRGRRLTLDELVAGVLILYPRYLDPVTGLPCPPEILIRRMQDGAHHNRLGWVTRIRQWQGRLTKGRA
jgi:capsular polysaccharide export protein